MPFSLSSLNAARGVDVSEGLKEKEAAVEEAPARAAGGASGARRGGARGGGARGGGARAAAPAAESAGASSSVFAEKEDAWGDDDDDEEEERRRRRGARPRSPRRRRGGARGGGSPAAAAGRRGPPRARTAAGARRPEGGGGARERSPPRPKKAPPKEYSKPAWAKVGDETSDKKTLKQATSILNKLTLEKFERLSAEFCALPFDSVALVKGAIDLIVDKAQHETHFVGIYAELCVKLSETPMTGLGEVEKGKKFRRMLLERCQAEFEMDHSAVQAELEALEPGPRKLRIAEIRKLYIGHMFFIGALYKHEMLKESIMHHCVQELFGDPDEPDGEKIECLAKLMATIGKQLDAAALEKKESMKFMKAYFKQLKKLAVNQKLESRIRFMVKDLCELRDDLWKPRRAVETAKTIAEIHDDIQREADIKAGLKPRSKVNREKAGVSEKTDDGWETVPTAGGRRVMVVEEKKPKKSSSKEAAAPKGGSMGSFGGFASLTSEKKKKKKDKGDKDEKKKKKKSSKDNLKELADDEAAGAAAPEATFDEGAYKAKCKAAVAEYMSIESVEEVVACATDELSALGGTEKLALLVAVALDVVLEGKAGDRARVAPLLVALADAKVLAAAHFAAAFLELLEFLPDLVIDTPKASEWLGDVLKALVAGGHADPAFLDTAPAAVAEQGEDALKTWAAFKAYVASA
ncbi:translation initiation factor [Aureococcus anophagefferens]|uniref:Translation initiation factor n=2 Tax=Aureococcus anophagefferens TaxID=44056 RepID=A0ABR1G074_AURAN